MSTLLDAVAGVINAAEPLPGLVVGGQPQPAHLAALKAAGCEVVIDTRDPMEGQPVAPADVRAAGLEYVNIPLGHSRGDDAVLARLRATAQQLVGKRKTFAYCNSGNRVAAALLPYFMLDAGLDEETAVETAMRCGMRSAELMEWALEYASKQA